MDSNPNSISLPVQSTKRREKRKAAECFLYSLCLYFIRFFNNQFNITRYYDLDAFMEIEPDL